MKFTVNSTEWYMVTCSKCHAQFAITNAHDNQLRKCHNTFYCPSGHDQYYPGKTDEEKLRAVIEERDQAQSQAANRANQVTTLEADLERTKCSLGRLKKKAKK